MTAQIPDRFDFWGRQCVLVGVRGGVLFDPSKYGLEPVGRSTACKRGYQCQYVVEQERLILTRLEITLGDFLVAQWLPEGVREYVGPEINGVRPVDPRSDFRFGHSDHNNLYDELNLEIPYTGKIRIADRFIQELYIHMGFQPTWKYERVLELRFDKGELLAVQDVSRKFEVIRSLMLKLPWRLGWLFHMRDR